MGKIDARVVQESDIRNRESCRGAPRESNRNPCVHRCAPDGPATVVYLRGKVGGEWKANLVFAKSRLNLSKQITIPRLVLLGTDRGKRSSVCQLRIAAERGKKISMVGFAVCTILDFQH